MGLPTASQDGGCALERSTRPNRLPTPAFPPVRPSRGRHTVVTTLSPGRHTVRAQGTARSARYGMIEFSVKPPTVPIPFHKLLKVVALVGGQDPQIRELLDHIAAERFEIEVTDRFDRDVSEDAAVGAYIAWIDDEHRERARQLGRAVRALGFEIPIWALADSHRISDVAVLGLVGEF